MMLQRGVGSGAALEGTSGLDAGQPRWRAWLGLDRGCFLHHSVSGRMREEYLISKLEQLGLNSCLELLSYDYF